MAMQRDFVLALKKETVLNVGILSKLQAMPLELSTLVFKENALEKPTQILFNYLSHYLICIIDPQAAKSLTWPLYDAETERSYKKDLCNFISEYSKKGLLSPVTSSYLVNHGSYKVTKLIFQLSQLAVRKLFMFKLKKDTHKELYNVMTKKSLEKEGSYQLEKEVDIISSATMWKVSNYLHKQKVMEKIEETMHITISKMESKTINARKYLDDLVDQFLSNHAIDDITKEKILSIKDVTKPSPFFDSWLSELDQQIYEMESKWNEKVSPFLKICKDTQFSTESLIARHTGEADKDSYMIEYNHEIDKICTKHLQKHVNTEQKYILKNIVKNEQLNFPNLIRGFLIAIDFILKNAEVGDEIYNFNEYLEGGSRNYSEVLEALKELNERVVNAESKLEPSPAICNQSVSVKDYVEIKPLRDLSCTREQQCQALFDSFTPLSMSKNKCNLRRKTNLNTLHTFTKPQSKSLLVTPFCSERTRYKFRKSLMPCHNSSYANLNATQNFHNLSVISQSRQNETVVQCSSGFTKQQISRLLSTQKSSSKKSLHKIERLSINIKKRGLFNESNSFNESNGLFRSHSSPNLFESREKRSVLRTGHRKLSIMQEDSVSFFGVSGIDALDKDSRYNTPESMDPETSRKLDTVPLIVVTSNPHPKVPLEDFHVNLDKKILIENILKIPASEDIEIKTDTPKTNEQFIRKTSSVEKLINRFKKVRKSVFQEYNQCKETSSEIRTIVEEKENRANKVHFTVNRFLLPDLVSPICSPLSNEAAGSLDQVDTDAVEKVCQRSRESLGTALGVDETFLDQFNLID